MLSNGCTQQMQTTQHVINSSAHWIIFIVPKISIIQALNTLIIFMLHMNPGLVVTTIIIQTIHKGSCELDVKTWTDERGRILPKQRQTWRWLRFCCKGVKSNPSVLPFCSALHNVHCVRGQCNAGCPVAANNYNCVEIKDKVSDAWYTGAGGHTKAKEPNTD